MGILELRKSLFFIFPLASLHCLGERGGSTEVTAPGVAAGLPGVPGMIDRSLPITEPVWEPRRAAPDSSCCPAGAGGCSGEWAQPPILEPHTHPCAPSLVPLLPPSEELILESPHGKPAHSSFSPGISHCSTAPAPVAVLSSVPLLWAVTHQHIPSDISLPKAVKAATSHHIPSHTEEWFNPDPSFIKATWNHRSESWLH